EADVESERLAQIVVAGGERCSRSEVSTRSRFPRDSSRRRKPSTAMSSVWRSVFETIDETGCSCEPVVLPEWWCCRSATQNFRAAISPSRSASPISSAQPSCFAGEGSPLAARSRTIGSRADRSTSMIPTATSWSFLRRRSSARRPSFHGGASQVTRQAASGSVAEQAGQAHPAHPAAAQHPAAQEQTQHAPLVAVAFAVVVDLVVIVVPVAEQVSEHQAA